MTPRTWLLVSLLVGGLAVSSPLRAGDQTGPAPFELDDGDRVVLVGNTFIERDQSHGYLETLLTIRYPDRDIIFRNLGWSGDTVFCDARAGFGTAEDGFQHLREHIEDLKPTVILVGYGLNESFEGRAGLSRFRDGLNRLLDMLAEASDGARIVLLAPLAHEDHGPPLPDPADHNASLRLYRDAIAETARTRALRFIDLLTWHEQFLADHPNCRLTDNGIHPTPYGHWRIAQAVEQGLGLEPFPGCIAWSEGALVTDGPDVDQVEALRQVINEKNLLYFHRWRPQNETYLFGFRKHEQGHLAPEVPQFDPLVAEKEAEIVRLRKSVACTYPWIGESEEDQ